jgi:hypothetical protein
MSGLSGLTSSISLQDSQLEIVYSEAEADDDDDDAHCTPARSLQAVSVAQQALSNSRGPSALQGRRIAVGSNKQQLQTEVVGAAAPQNTAAAGNKFINYDGPFTHAVSSNTSDNSQMHEPQVQASEQSYGSADIEFDSSTASIPQAETSRTFTQAEAPLIQSVDVAPHSTGQHAVGPVSADLQAAADATQQLFASLAIVPHRPSTASDSSTCRSSYTSCSAAGSSSSEDLVTDTHEATLRSYLMPADGLSLHTADRSAAATPPNAVTSPQSSTLPSSSCAQAATEQGLSPQSTRGQQHTPVGLVRDDCNSRGGSRASSRGRRQDSKSERLITLPDVDFQQHHHLAPSSSHAGAGAGAADDLLRGLQCIVQMEQSASVACLTETGLGMKHSKLSSPVSLTAAAAAAQSSHMTAVQQTAGNEHLHHRQELLQPGAGSNCSKYDLMLPSCDINELLRQQVPARAAVDEITTGAAGAAGSSVLVAPAGAKKQRSVALQVGSNNDKGTQVKV